MEAAYALEIFMGWRKGFAERSVFTKSPPDNTHQNTSKHPYQTRPDGVSIGFFHSSR
jgi:hypothetical protein